MTSLSFITQCESLKGKERACATPSFSNKPQKHTLTGSQALSRSAQRAEMPLGTKGNSL